MEPYLIAGVVFLGVAVVVTVALLAHKAEKRRTEQIAQIAAEMGFSFDAAGSITSAAAGNLPVFGKGHSKKSKNVMRKVVRGSEVTLLDYQYTIGSGKNRHTVKMTVAVFFAQEGQSFPSFEMQPEAIWHKIGSYFGYQDIDFESHPVFSSAYLLRGTDEPAIRAAFTPEVLDFLEKAPMKWCVETRSNRMAIFRQSRVKPEHLKEFLADATRLFLLFIVPG